MEQKFRELKEQYNNAILFFKLGDYYHTYYEDAKIVGNNCWFEYRVKDVPTCSVPFDCINSCVNRLESFDYKVEILRDDV